jgi:pimeloyl-ACP methyl ester carboxylesterase
VVTVESRGTGRSDPLQRPYPLSRHVDDVLAVLDALGPGPKVGVGLSRSGNLLCRLAHGHPTAFAKLVTIGFAPGPPGQPPFFTEAYLAENRRLAASGNHEEIVCVHTAFVFSEPSTQLLRDLFVRSRLALPTETTRSFFDPDPTVDVTPILGEIDLPILVTHGGADRLTDVAAAHYTASRLPNARLHIFPDKGHLPLFTATDDFCTVLEGFVGTNRPLAG